MNDQVSESAKRTMASIQEGIDRDRFEELPLVIVERFLDSFASDGSQTFEVPKHILEALAVRFRQFLNQEAESLEDAFGGQMKRQRQAIDRALQVDEVTFAMTVEMKRLNALSPAERGPGNVYAIASETVAEQAGMSDGNVGRLYQLSQPKPAKTPKKAQRPE